MFLKTAAQALEAEDFVKEISVFSPNAGKYGPEKTLYLDTFHAVLITLKEIFYYLKLYSLYSYFFCSCYQYKEFYIKYYGRYLKIRTFLLESYTCKQNC